MESYTQAHREARLSLLERFLSYPLNDSTPILQAFAALPNAIFCQGSHPLERFVYISGTRSDPVLLVAHTDTVWDRHYDREEAHAQFQVTEDRIVSLSEQAGLGADDRAGCAMLWHFRNSGHSLLLLDGEEKGHYGAKYLARDHRKLLRELNRHCYILTLDYPGGRICHYHGVHNSSAFRKMIEQTYHCQVVTQKKGSDLPYLCRNACGVNIGVGYHSAHKATEFLSIPQWLDTLSLLEQQLPTAQKPYRTRKLPRLKSYTLTQLKKIYAHLRKLFLPNPTHPQ